MNKPQCNCIMSGFAQTTNYCPVHKEVPIKGEPQLSAEMEKRFDEKFVCNEHPMEEWHYQDLDPDEVKNFLATALEEQYKKALSDMFLAIAKLAEPDERQLSAGDLTTNMDNIWEIKVKLEKAILNGKGAE